MKCRTKKRCSLCNPELALFYIREFGDGKKPVDWVADAAGNHFRISHLKNHEIVLLAHNLFEMEKRGFEAGQGKYN